MPRQVRIELLGLQTAYRALFGDVPVKYTNTILALTGGGAVLDPEVTASFALGYCIDFPLNGSLQNWDRSERARLCPWITTWEQTTSTGQK